MATVQTMTEETQQGLTGRTIVRVGENWIQFDNGLRVYISDEEVVHINEMYEG